jgi:hypothetical protein
MTEHKATVDDNVLIGRGHWDVPVRIKVEAYLRFSRRMDQQLRRLVIRWAHLAAPTARQQANQTARSRRSKR